MYFRLYVAFDVWKIRIKKKERRYLIDNNTYIWIPMLLMYLLFWNVER